MPSDDREDTATGVSAVGPSPADDDEEMKTAITAAPLDLLDQTAEDAPTGVTRAPSQLGIFTRSDPRRERANIQFHVQPLSLDKFGDPLHRFPAITVSAKGPGERLTLPRNDTDRSQSQSFEDQDRRFARRPVAA